MLLRKTYARTCVMSTRMISEAMDDCAPGRDQAYIKQDCFNRKAPATSTAGAAVITCVPAALSDKLDRAHRNT